MTSMTDKSFASQVVDKVFAKLEVFNDEHVALTIELVNLRARVSQLQQALSFEVEMNRVRGDEIEDLKKRNERLEISIGERMRMEDEI